MSKVLAQAKKIYRCVEPAELEKIAGSMHHGGIVAVVAPAPLRAPTVEDLRAWARRGEALLVLDRIVPRDLPATCVSPARPSFPLTASDRSRSCLNPTGARGGGRTHTPLEGDGF